MEKSNSFERLVSTISHEERASLLEKLKPITEEQKQVISVTQETEAPTQTIQELFKKE